MTPSSGTAAFARSSCATSKPGRFAADGFARVTGQPGVICTTAGPGATNALTGIGEAWADSVPVLLITGQVNHDRLHQECGNYHEIDLESIFRPCTKFAATVMGHQQIPAHGRPGISSDDRRPTAPGGADLAAGFDGQKCAFSRDVATEVTPRTRFHCDRNGNRQSGRAPGATQNVRSCSPAAAPSGRTLARNCASSPNGLHCPVLTSLNGKGILDERDPLSLGHARSSRGRVALAGCRCDAGGRLPIHRGDDRLSQAAGAAGG